MFDLPSLGFVALVTAVFALGGFVKGVVGLGLPTIAMGLLSMLMLPAQAAALLVVPSLVTNLWQIGTSGCAYLVARRRAAAVSRRSEARAGCEWHHRGECRAP